MRATWDGSVVDEELYTEEYEYHLFSGLAREALSTLSFIVLNCADQNVRREAKKTKNTTRGGILAAVNDAVIEDEAFLTGLEGIYTNQVERRDDLQAPRLIPEPTTPKPVIEKRESLPDYDEEQRDTVIGYLCLLAWPLVYTAKKIGDILE